MFTLYRTYLEDKTVGVLVFPNGDTVFTLERPWLDNKVSVSCIPEGQYRVKRDKTGRWQWYAIQDVPGRTFIEIHPANKVSHLEGCIGLGKGWYDEKTLHKSVEACKKLLNFHGDDDFILVIQEDYLGEYTPAIFK